MAQRNKNHLFNCLTAKYGEPDALVGLEISGSSLEIEIKTLEIFRYYRIWHPLQIIRHKNPQILPDDKFSDYQLFFS